MKATFIILSFFIGMAMISCQRGNEPNSQIEQEPFSMQGMELFRDFDLFGMSGIEKKSMDSPLFMVVGVVSKNGIDIYDTRWKGGKYE